MGKQSADTARKTDQLEETLGEGQDLVRHLWTGRLLHAAVNVGMFERLENEPTLAETFADRLDLDHENSYCLLRALSHHGVLPKMPTEVLQSPP